MSLVSSLVSNAQMRSQRQQPLSNYLCLTDDRHYTGNSKLDVESLFKKKYSLGFFFLGVCVCMCGM